LNVHRPLLALVALLLLGAACLAAGAGAAPGVTAAGVKEADAPILVEIGEKAPAATQVFVNCPKGNGIGIEPYPGEEEPEIPSGPGYQCEFRYLSEGNVVKGQDEVENHPLHTDEYLLVNVAVLSTAPPTWMSCPTGFSHGKLSSKGTECGIYTEGIAEEIEEAALAERGSGRHIEVLPRLLPSRFSVGDARGKQGLEVGFVTERYECHAHARRISRNRQHDSGGCSTRFGDAIKFSFDTEAPRLRNGPRA
jgi:hypothetical protein